MSDAWLDSIQAEAKDVAESLAFVAPELWPMHVQRLFDVIFENQSDKPIIWKES